MRSIKYLVLPVGFMLFCLISHAQIVYVNIDKKKAEKELEKIKAKTIYVLLMDADSLYNNRIKKLVEKYYRYSAVDFIRQSALNKLDNDPGAVILTVSSYTYHSSTYNPSTLNSYTTHFGGLCFGLFLYNSSKGAFSNETPLSGENELLLATEFPNITDDKKASEIIGCVPQAYGDAYTQMGFMVFLNALNNFSKGIRSREEMAKEIKANTPRLKDKTLLVAAPDLCMHRDSVKSNYGYPVKIVEFSDISKAILAQDSSVAIYWPNYSGYSSTQLVVCPGAWDIVFASAGLEVVKGSSGFRLNKNRLMVHFRRENVNWEDKKAIGTGFSPLTSSNIRNSIGSEKHKK